MKKPQEKRIARIADYQSTFSTPHGKRVLYQMMKSAGFMDTNFVSGDSHYTAFKEGQRSVVTSILQSLKVDVRQLEAQLTKGGTDDEEFDI